MMGLSIFGDTPLAGFPRRRTPEQNAIVTSTLSNVDYTCSTDWCFVRNSIGDIPTALANLCALNQYFVKS